MIRQMKTYGGDTILLSDNQYKLIVDQYDNGATEFLVGSQRIPRSSISFLGFTDGAAETMRVEEQNYTRTLSADETKALKEARYKEACRVGEGARIKMLESAKERVWKSLATPDIVVQIEKETLPEIAMSEEESERGAAEYYLDEHGQKMYS